MSRRPDLSLHSRPWRPTYQPSVGPLSTFDDADALAHRLGRAGRPAAAGRWPALTGALVTLPLVAPAAWLAQAVVRRPAAMCCWPMPAARSGRAMRCLVLTAGPGSCEAAGPARPAGLAAEPGRWPAPQPALRHDCCLGGEPRLIVRPGLGRVEGRIQPSPDGPDGRIGQWPAAWLVGLGTPFNTMRPGGALQLGTRGPAPDLGPGPLLDGRQRDAGAARSPRRG